MRYAEVDQQGIVFNAHYLLWCDEALAAWCAELNLQRFAESVRLVTSTLTWSGPARWGDVVEVDAACTRVGTTSVGLRFDVRAGGRPCCRVETTYVYADAAGEKQPIPPDLRERLLSPPAY